MHRKLYAAPLEGLTGFVWRKSHSEVFGGADKYFTPFISPNSNCSFQTKEYRDITQGEPNLVPQVLANKAEHIIWVAGEFSKLGYSEMNLNFGCPSGTVVSKRKGSGALRDLVFLDELLYEVYSSLPDMKISIKTRIGVESSEEWSEILKVYEKYPVHELIIHPRTRSEMYKGAADRKLFFDTLASTKLPLVYNGDTFKKDDEVFQRDGAESTKPFGVMSGRGLLQNPALFREARGGSPATRDELIKFYDLLIEGYRTYMPGDMPLMQRMKEFWFYFSKSFEVSEAQMKKLYKTKKYVDYEAAARAILSGCELAELRNDA